MRPEARPRELRENGDEQRRTRVRGLSFFLFQGLRVSEFRVKCSLVVPMSVRLGPAPVPQKGRRAWGLGLRAWGFGACKLAC